MSYPFDQFRAPAGGKVFAKCAAAPPAGLTEGFLKYELKADILREPTKTDRNSLRLSRIRPQSQKCIPA